MKSFQELTYSDIESLSNDHIRFTCHSSGMNSAKVGGWKLYWDLKDQSFYFTTVDIERGPRPSISLQEAHARVSDLVKTIYSGHVKAQFAMWNPKAEDSFWEQRQY